MSEVHDDTGHDEFPDSVSESDDNVSLSDPGSDTDAGDSGSEEDCVVTDRVAEEVNKDQPLESDTDSAHAAHHDQEVEAYMERTRSQAVLGRLPSLPDRQRANFAQAGDVLGDTNIEPAASEQHSGASLIDNGRSISADANRFDEAVEADQQNETRSGDNGHSTSTNAHSDTEPVAEEQNELSVGNNGHGANEDAQTSVSYTELAGGQEQQAEIPALTAETQPDAVLPSIQAVSEASDYASVPERLEAVSEASDYASIEPEPESDSAPEPAPESETVVIEAESEPASVPEPEPESETMPETDSGAAQPSQGSAFHDDADQGDPDMDAAGQQPAATRADFAEIQRLLGRAASEGSNASTESHQHKTASAPREAAQEDLAESNPVDDEPPADAESARSREPEVAAQTETMVQQSEAQDSRDGGSAPEDGDSAPEDDTDDTTDSTSALVEPAHVAASASEATASSSSETPAAGGFARLPSLPVRRGAPSLPARPSTSTGATPAASVNEQQRAAPASAAPPAGNGAPSMARPATAGADAPGNGHAEATAPSGNGSGSATGASSSTTVARASSSSSSTPAVKPSSTSSNPSQPPSGNAAPSMPPRPAGSATPTAAAKAPGSANPSIPPRQPAAGKPSAAPQPAGNGQAGPAPAAAAADDEPAENRELREKVQKFRVLLVQLTMRLGQSTRGSIVQQVNYRLDLAERIRIPQTSSNARRPYGFEAAIRTAEAQEAAHPEQALPFACTVMVIGMTGVGKSATINSVLNEDEAAPTNAFEPATRGIRVITGTVAGVRVKFIDTPGLQPSAVNIGSNQRLLNQMHGAFKKHKPDIMLYMDRADIFRTDMADVPLLRAITETFGANMWFNTIVALTHAAAAPPDGNNGPLTYDTYTRSRTQLLQQNIRQASGDGRLLNPVALVENHPACRRNDQGWGILPNQQVWKPHLILLLLSSKLLSETDSLLKIQQNTGAANNQQANALRMLLGGAGRKMPPIPYLIASFIQKKSPRKPPDEERQFKHDSELKDLNVMEKKEEMRRRREYSRMRSDEAKAEAGATQAGVPAPDIPLQPTFDADNNTHRYRYMEPPPDAALCRPVMDPNGFDHDDGMNAFTVEKNTVIRKKGVYVGGAPAYLMTQVHKERDLFSVVSEAEASYYHTHKLISTASLDGQTVQSDVLYTGKLETRFKNHPKNKTGAGILVSRLKEDGGLPTKGPVVYGGKIMDRFKPTDKVKVILASATVMNKPQGQMPREQAWNHSAETRIKAGDDDKLLVTVGLNNMRYRGKSGYGGNVSTQYAATPGTTVMGNLQLNNERAGKMTMRVSSHDYPKLGFSLLVPTLAYVWGRIRGQD